MARTAFSGKRIQKSPNSNKTINTSQKQSKSPFVSQKETKTPINSQLNVARKKSMSVKTPRILAPIEKPNEQPRIKKRSMVYKEIKFFQRSTDMLINKLPFTRFVREIVAKLSENNRNYRFTRTALLVMQEAFEAFVVSLLEDSNLCAGHAKRVTLKNVDIDLVKKLAK